MKDFKKLRIMKIKTFRVQKYFLKIEMKFTEYKNWIKFSGKKIGVDELKKL